MRRWVARAVLAGLVLLLGLIASLLLGEAAARGQYRDDYPPPGKMVSLKTHDIHLHCEGEGKPTVVLESDLDQLGSLSWDRVQSQVARFTRVCAYDRAGIMWSEPGPLPRDGETIAAELGAVLEAVGEGGPFVLVGHAHGGAYVRIFAGRNPDAVCAMVLVDSSHPDQLARFAEVGLRKEIPNEQIRPVILLLSHVGFPGRFQGPQYSMPRAVYDAEQAFLPQSSIAWFDESVEAAETLVQAGEYGSLGHIPLIVLASARPSAVSAPTGGRDLQETWLELQRELAVLSTNGSIRLLEGSGHYPQFDQPEVVVEAIQVVVQRCLANRVQ